MGAYLKFALTGFFLSCLVNPFLGSSAIAQIVPDQTLPSNSTVTTNGSTLKIDGGTTVGSNLFHSFSTFSVGTGKTAFFDNGLAVNNILARVTGTSFSSINGLIKANGSANLFLINPNGILFGPNASLDIGGSFVATTANAIKFSDGIYSAVQPQSNSLLTVNVPLGLQYGKEVQPISVIGSSLKVKTDKTLALVGGDVSLDSARLSVSGGSLELGGLAEPGTVGLTFENNIPRLSVPSNITRGNVSVNSTNIYSDDFFGNGGIAINAKNIDIGGNSLLGSGLLLDVGGDINLDATNNIKINNSRIRSFVDRNFQGNGGNMNISTGGAFLLDSSSQIQSVTLGDGRSGDIKIATGSSLSLDNGSRIQVLTTNDGDTGDINIATGSSLSLNNGSQIGATTTNYGDTGDINIATGSSLSLNNGSQIGTATTSYGRAGDINVTGSLISLDADLTASNSNVSSSMFSYNSQESSGESGNINIFAKNLSLDNGAIISNSTSGKGNAGSINISADRLLLTGESIIGNSTSGAANAGNINIKADSLLSEDDKAKITSFTLGKGNAGDINIFTNKLMVITQLG